MLSLGWDGFVSGEGGRHVLVWKGWEVMDDVGWPVAGMVGIASSGQVDGGKATIQ